MTAIAGWACNQVPTGSAVRQDGAVRDATLPADASRPDEPAAQGTGGGLGTGGAANTGGYAGAGGIPGTGGATQVRDAGRQDVVGSGGNSGTGGATAPGGSTSTGGASSSGGTVGAGGSLGAGGAVGNGGTSTTGGTVGGGGTSGTGGGAGTRTSSPDAATDAVGSRDTGIAAIPIPDAAGKSDAPQIFWTTTYAANCAPPAIGGRDESDGHHRPGEDCMRSGCHLNPKTANHHAGTDCRGSGCHSNGSPDGSGAPAFLFGGTVYRAVTLAADPKVEVGVKATQGMYVACSANNGNFWVVAPSNTKTLTWSGAGVRLRNANGEAPMMTTAAAGCNASACHTGTLKMTSP